MSDSPSSQRLQVNRPSIIDETIDGEVVAVDLQQGSYYSIRGAGVQIWRSLAEPSTPEGVVTLVAEHFGRPEDQVTEAVRSFIADLNGHGLLKPAEDGSDYPDPSDPAPDASTEYEPPLLEKFTDMEDLLLLDPVHEVDGRGWPHPAPLPVSGRRQRRPGLGLRRSARRLHRGS